MAQRCSCGKHYSDHGALISESRGRTETHSDTVCAVVDRRRWLHKLLYLAADALRRTADRIPKKQAAAARQL